MDQKRLGCNAGHKRSAGVTQEVNLRNPSCAPNGGRQAVDPWFETLVKRYQMFKTGVPPPPRNRTYILPIFTGLLFVGS